MNQEKDIIIENMSKEAADQKAHVDYTHLSSVNREKIFFGIKILSDEFF